MSKGMIMLTGNQMTVMAIKRPNESTSSQKDKKESTVGFSKLEQFHEYVQSTERIVS